MAQPVIGTVSAARTTGEASTLTFSATVATGEKLIVWVSHYDPFISITGVTFNGDAMTAIAAEQQQQRVYYLATPDVGTFNVVVTLSSTRWLCAEAIPVSNFDGVFRNIGIQAGETYLAATFDGTTPSLTVAAGTDDLVIAHVHRPFTLNQLFTPGSGQTLIQQQLDSTENELVCASSYKDGAASVTMSWTLSPASGWFSSLGVIALTENSDPDPEPDPTPEPEFVTAWADAEGGPFSDDEDWEGGYKEARILRIS